MVPWVDWQTTVIACSPRDRYYHRAKEFLPERWLRDNSGAREHPIHSLAFLPFGFGARSCIGRRFAEQELYIATVKVLRVRMSVVCVGVRERERMKDKKGKRRLLSDRFFILNVRKNEENSCK